MSSHTVFCCVALLLFMLAQVQCVKLVAPIGGGGGVSLLDPGELGTGMGSALPPPNPHDVERQQKLDTKIGREQIKAKRNFQATYGAHTLLSRSQERILKSDAKQSLDEMKALSRNQAPKNVPKLWSSMESLSQDAVALRRKQWVSAKSAQRRARRAEKAAAKGVRDAKYAMSEIKMKNDVERSSFKNISLTEELRDPVACSPFPQCLVDRLANGTCGNTYPTVACIRARRGDINLCQISDVIQDNCCGICLLSNYDLCVKERLILAGFGDDKPDNTTVPLHLVESYDQECHEMARKDFVQKDKENTQPLSPTYNLLIKQEYDQRYPNGPPNGTNSNLTDLTDVTNEEELVEVKDEMDIFE